jgi:hypothetical protein
MAHSIEKSLRLQKTNKRAAWLRRVPRPQPTLFVVTRDGALEQVRMHSLRMARVSAFHFNQTGNCRAAFAMWR